MKPGQVWTLFSLCLAAALVAMGWSSAMVLRLERAEVAANAQAALEENTRLALWRMDSSLTPLLAQEAARPFFHYHAFYPAVASEGVIASPLLRETPPRVLLHFQLALTGEITSPQVPEGAHQALAVRQGLALATILSRQARLRELKAAAPLTSLLKRTARRDLEDADGRAGVLRPTPVESIPTQRLKSAKEFEARQQSYAQANTLSLSGSTRITVGLGRHLAVAAAGMRR